MTLAKSNTMFGDDLSKDNLADLKLDRQSFATICFGTLIDQGYSLEEIISDGFAEKRKQIGKEVYELSLAKKSEWEQIDDDLIAAVGTYFSKVGEKYTIQVYVNGKLVYTQKGVSEYQGYATIPLDKYIKVSKGDSFFISVESSTVPLVVFSRGYSSDNSSFIILS